MFAPSRARRRSRTPHPGLSPRRRCPPPARGSGTRSAPRAWRSGRSRGRRRRPPGSRPRRVPEAGGARSTRTPENRGRAGPVGRSPAPPGGSARRARGQDGGCGLLWTAAARILPRGSTRGRCGEGAGSGPFVMRPPVLPTIMRRSVRREPSLLPNSAKRAPWSRGVSMIGRRVLGAVRGGAALPFAEWGLGQVLGLRPEVLVSVAALGQPHLPPQQPRRARSPSRISSSASPIPGTGT